MNPRPGRDAVRSQYECDTSNYINVDLSHYLTGEKEHGLNAQEEMNRMEIHAKPGKLLEIGCGGGFLLEEAVACVWQAIGTEVSVSHVEAAQKIKSIRTYQGDLLHMTMPEAPFDVVVMLNVLSHLDDPLETFKKVNALLDDGGHFILRTGNKADLSRKQDGEVLSGYWGAPEHLYCFGEKSIHRICELSGFVPPKSQRHLTWI